MKTILKNVEFVLSKEYTDSKSRKLTASVTLDISVTTESFNIIPNPKKFDNSFGFIGTSKENSEMWIAVAQLIEEAVVFAKNYINDLKVKP